MKNQMRPLCYSKDKIWARTDKLQRCRRLPLEHAKLREKLRQILEGVLTRKWFDRWYVAESLCDRLLGKIITFSFRNNMNPAWATNFSCTNFHNIHQDGSVLCQALTCLMLEEIPAHLLQSQALTRCQNPLSSVTTTQFRHQPQLVRAVHLRQPRTRRLRIDGVEKRKTY